MGLLRLRLRMDSYLKENKYMALERFSDEERDLIDSENTNSSLEDGDKDPGEDMVGDENEAQPTE